MKRLTIVIILTGRVFFGVPYAHAMFSLSQAEFALKNRAERISNKKINKQVPAIARQDFLQTMSLCVALLSKQLTTKKSWAHERMCPEQQTIIIGAFKDPYVQKVVVVPGSQVTCFGDIHGSVHSLLRCLKWLCDLGYMNDDFSIAQDHPNFYLMFLGDYVDRGFYGLEVLYLLMKLKIANPERVFLVRGNHENVPANRTWGFGEELYAKYGKSFNLSELSRLFQLLPLACYIGCQSGDGEKDFVLCCHGGPDVSFDPVNFLASSEQIAFQKIEEFRYQSYATKKIQSLNPDIRQKKSLDQLKKKAHEKGIIWSDNKNTQPDNWLMKFGFIWTDFDIYDQSDELLQFTRRCWLLGRSMTKALLETSDQKIRVHAVMRGHQHHGKLYDELVKRKGFVRSWDGMVNTIFSGPAAKTFVKKDHEKDFDYDSFVMITTAQAFKNWSFTHWHEPISEKNWNAKKA